MFDIILRLALFIFGTFWILTMLSIIVNIRDVNKNRNFDKYE